MRFIQPWFQKLTLLLVCFSLSTGLLIGWPATALAARGYGLPPGNAVTDPEAILRQALPIDNQPIRQIQANLEGISERLREKRWGAIDSDISKARKVLNSRQSEILASVPEGQKAAAQTLVKSIQAEFTPLKTAADAEDREQLNQSKSKLLSLVGELEAAMIPKFPFEVPADYRNLPQLKGRAVVEMTTDKGLLKMVVDGYSAPVTAGNFVDLVQKGFYNGLEFTRSEASYVLQTGDPPGPEEGFIDPATDEYRAVPLEVLVKGESKPVYGTTLEAAGRYRDQPVLPFSAYGALAMARPGDDPNGGSSQFFFFLFDPALTPPGLNLLDGRYSTFGYVVEGKEVLEKLKQGDKIETAKVVQGADHLVQPQAA